MKKRTGMYHGNERGFTLLEFTVVIGVLGIVALGTLLFMKPITNLWVLQRFQQGTAAETRLALLRMTREINQIRDLGSISAATSGTLRFYDSNNTDITYALSGSVVTRNGTALLKNASSLTFQYYDFNQNLLATPVISPQTNIRRIEISLTASESGKSLTLKSHATPRNLSW